jgi:hypothetical protein
MQFTTLNRTRWRRKECGLWPIEDHLKFSSLIRTEVSPVCQLSSTRSNRFYIQIGPSVTRFNSPGAWWNRYWIGRICSGRCRASHHAQADPDRAMHPQGRASYHAQAGKANKHLQNLLRPPKPVATALLPLDLSPHDPQFYSVRPTCEGSTCHNGLFQIGFHPMKECRV